MARFRPPTDSTRRFKELTPGRVRRAAGTSSAGSVFQFGWGAVVCAGASKMHSLETYPLAMIASVMAFIGPFVPVGIRL